MLSQVSRKMGSENAHGRAQNADNGLKFVFLELYLKDETKVSITSDE
jgi:hypothetical protein